MMLASLSLPTRGLCVVVWWNGTWRWFFDRKNWEIVNAAGRWPTVYAGPLKFMTGPA